MSELLTLGVPHKTAPLDLRERLSLTEGRAVGALHELTAVDGIHEAAAISTCNRTELYLIVSDPVEAESTALGVLTRQAEIRPTELLSHLYSLRATEAARHLLQVTAGLDSMILGEAEIQGQVKRAYELSMVEGATGPVLNRLFRDALTAGGRAREETGISQKGVSIPSVAVELARRAIGDLSDRGVLVVGAGETAERWDPELEPASHQPLGNTLIPGSRVRYLAEIAEQGRQINADVDRLAELAQTCLSASQDVADGWSGALSALQVPSGAAGNTLESGPLLTAHTDAANAAAIAVGRLVSVLEADVDAVYLCAFDFSATDEAVARGFEDKPPPPTPDPTPSPEPGPAPTPPPTAARVA